MSKNKGVIGIGLVIAIVLGIVVVGGGAYYLGSSKNNQGVIIDGNTLSNNNDGDIGKTEEVPSRGSAICDKNTTPWVILVSPNGGESYVLNQKVDVKWKSCNIPTGVDVGISILNELGLNPVTIADNVALQQTPNDGIETIALTEQKDMQKFILGNKFKIRLNYVFTEKYNGPYKEDGRYPEWANQADESDNYFTINSARNNISLANFSSNYIRPYPGQWPPVVQNSTTPYSCSTISRDVFDTPTTLTGKQKNINGKTFCVYSFSDVGAGHAAGVYSYITTGLNGVGTKRVDFRLDWPNGCGGYGGPGEKEYDQCKNDQSTFFNNLDAYIASLM